MDGPRVLSNHYLSYLIISEPEISPGNTTSKYDILMCAPHFIGDGTALHQSTHELICLVTSEKSDAELVEELNKPQNWVGIPLLKISSHNVELGGRPTFERRIEVIGSVFGPWQGSLQDQLPSNP
jgi:hypothetical protein